MSITPLVQRQEEEEKEEIQTNPLTEQTTPMIQMQVEPEEEEEEPIQAKLTDSTQVQRQLGGKEEEEKIQSKPFVTQIDPIVQRQVEEEGEEPIQAKSTANSTQNLYTQIQSLKGGGQSLSKEQRSFFEPRFNADFSQVRLHVDSKAVKAAKCLNAKAFTIGRNITFGDGQYSPTSQAGKRLLAHELTHVVQQKSFRIKGIKRSASNRPGNRIGFSRSNQDNPFIQMQNAGRCALPRGTVKEQRDDSILFQQRHIGNQMIQRKLALHSRKDNRAFKWFLTSNDAKNFQFRRRKPYTVSIKRRRTRKIDDTFRFNILKKIITNSSELLIIRYSQLDAPTPPHMLYRNGRIVKRNSRTTLRNMSYPLGAGGVTIASKKLAFAAEPHYTGPATGIANQSWILYSYPHSLAHEFGHAFLLFSGSPFGHGKTIPRRARIKGPSGRRFTGKVDVFINKFVAEKFAQLVIIDKGALHFSPTHKKKWPEPPHFKFNFIGTWLEFKKKYPGAKVSQKVRKRRGKIVKRTLRICVPLRGQICP